MWADSIPSQFTDALVNMLQYSQQTLCSQDEYIYYDYARISYHESGRNTLAADFVGDWLLQLDTDHAFAPDLLERLLLAKSSVSARVISGIYGYKVSPHSPVAHQWNKPDDPNDYTFTALTHWDRTKNIIEIGPCGGGCLLVDRSVFDEIEQKLGQQPFSIIPGLSEDYSFFLRCKLCGIKTYLATRVQAHHLAPRHFLSVDDYLDTLVLTHSETLTSDTLSINRVGSAALI